MRAAPFLFASVLKENLNKDLNPMVDEQNVCREVKYRQIAVYASFAFFLITLVKIHPNGVQNNVSNFLGDS